MSEHGPNTNEPFWWLLFSAGGVVSAMIVPAMMIATVMMGARGWVSHEAGVSPEHYALTYFHFKALLANPICKLIMFVMFALPMFHCMHRVRHTLEETPLGAWHTLITGSCYLFAIVACTFCAIALMHIK